MTENVEPRREWASLLLVLYATMVGAGVRLAMPLHSSAPLNDGGLFYSMIMDIQENNFILPAFTSYNAARIPFAYPPLAFYMTALISSFLHISAFNLLRLMPPIISALTIPAFYLLAKEILQSRAQIALAVLLFAFIPRALDWLIMGGGITRSLGLLFALLAIRQFYSLFPATSNRAVFPAIALGSLVIYTHPEAAVHSALSAVIFYLVRDRSLQGLRRGLLVGLGTAALSAPWWLRVIVQHGMGTLVAPFSAAGADSPGIGSRLFALFAFKFTDENFLSLTAVLGLLGLAVLIVRRQHLLPFWLIGLYLVEPRGGTLYMMIPHAMMAAVALDALILPGLKYLQHGGSRGPTLEEAPANPSVAARIDGRLAKILLVYVLLYGIVSATMVTLLLSQKYSLKPGDLEAFSWVKENTPSGSRFVLLTGENVLRDTSSEWFPALTGRRSLATVFGYEWFNDGQFSDRRADYDSLQACANRDTSCLDAWSRDTGQAIDYVFIRKFVEDRPVDPALESQLARSGQYQQVYKSDGVVIFRRTGP